MLAYIIALSLMQAPPIIITPHVQPGTSSAASANSSDMLSVRIMSPAGTLWQGAVRVAPNQNASYEQNLTQAAAQLCPAGTYDRSERQRLHFSIFAQQPAPSVQSYRVDVQWGRPIEGGDCGEGGTRTVQIQQSIVLQRGQSVSLAGDGGLRVQISRR